MKEGLAHSGQYHPRQWALGCKRKANELSMEASHVLLWSGFHFLPQDAALTSLGGGW